MRKTVAAAVAGLMLAAGPITAAAASEGQAVRLGDRVGAKSETASQLYGIPTVVWIGAVLAVVILVAAADDDDKDNDAPISA